MPNVEEIVTNFLINSDFDGLYQPRECACRTMDLCPCGDMHYDCEAGYERVEPNGSEYDFTIGPDKPETKTEDFE